MRPKFLDKKNLKLVFTAKCPQCETEDLFENHLYKVNPFLKMHSRCPNCDLDYVPEPGFYFGSAYFSYFVNVVWFGIGSLLIWLFYTDPGMTEYIVINSLIMVVMLPYTYALSRSIWLNYIFHAHLKEKEVVISYDFNSELEILHNYGIDTSNQTVDFWKEFTHKIHYQKECIHCGFEFEDFNTSGYKHCRNCLKDFTYKEYLTYSLEEFKLLQELKEGIDSKEKPN